MGNLTKNTITRGAVVALALSAGAATTANAAVTRVSGTDRYATASQVAASWPTTPDTAILAAGSGHNVDALTVAPLAKKLNAPIILVDATATPATIVAQFSAYKTVYIANGTGVISSAVQTALTAAGKTVTRLGGSTRYETALNIAKAFGTATDIVVANGDDAHLVDSLSIASIAAAKGMPIFLSSATSLDPAEATFAKGVGAKNVYVLGGSTVVSDAAAAGLGTVTRLAGATRYATNVAVVTNFKSDAALDLSNVYVASGEDANLIDSLVAAPLAGLKKAPIVFDHDGNNTDTNTFLNSGIITKDTNVTVLGGLGAVTADAAGAIQNIEVPGSYVPTASNTNVGPLAVSSTIATSATTFQVKFNQAPADTTKVVFAATREGAAVALTATWDTTNTIATLTYASNLPEDTYAIDVKNGTTDLGSNNVTITTQKIAKITITSTTLGVAQATTSTNTSGSSITTAGNGYALYKVFDQYGADITTNGLAQGITWNCGVGNATGLNGLITVTPYSGTNNYLTQYTTTSLNGIDQSSGVIASSNLTITNTPATLSAISLNKIYCPGNTSAVFTAGDTTDTFYIDYTATDLSGNPTTNMKLIQAGLMQDGTGKLTGLSSSNPTAADVTLVADPANSNNALIQVTPKSGTNYPSDQQIVISAFTNNGKQGSINLTLKKALGLNKLTLMAPSTTVAAGDKNVIIPFTALDQNGTVLTKYSDIVGSVGAPNVTISGSIGTATPHIIDNPDGTASLQVDLVPTSTVVYPQTSESFTVGASVTGTSNYSTINVVVQAAAIPNTLTVSTTQAVPNMESGAVQNIGFGCNFGGLAINDQYGRAMDITNQDITQSYYYVKAVSSIPASVAINSDTAFDGLNIQLAAVGAAGAGSSTVTYTVYKHTPAVGTTAATDVAVSGVTPISQQYTVVKTTDITGYTLGTIASLYDAASTSAVTTASPIVVGGVVKVSTGSAVYIAGNNYNAADTTKTNVNNSDIGDYKFTANVFGTTSGGGQVALANTDIIGATVDNSNDFVADWSGNAINAGTPSVGVLAKNTLSSTKPTATATLVAIVTSADGLVHRATTAVNSINTIPVAKSVSFSVDRADSHEASDAKTGISNNIYDTQTVTGIGVNGNNITMTKDQFLGNVGKGVLGKVLVNVANSSAVYFCGVDQYGTSDAPFSTLTATSSNSNYTLTVDTSNKLQLASGSASAIKAGDVITLNAVTTSGLVESVKITLN